MRLRERFDRGQKTLLAQFRYEREGRLEPLWSERASRAGLAR
jgi:hypothetical protein